MENDSVFNLNLKVDTAVHPDIKAELPGMDIDLPDQTAEWVSLDPNTASDFMDIDHLNNLADNSAQNPDDIDVTQNITSINETSNSEIPTINFTFNNVDSTDTYQNNGLTDILPEVTTIPNITQLLTSEPIINTDGEE